MYISVCQSKAYKQHYNTQSDVTKEDKGTFLKMFKNSGF